MTTPTTVRISVAKQFSRFPAGRYETDGPFSGEVFRRDILAPTLRKKVPVIVNLDGTLGYGSSFLEEAFGGLIRSEGFTFDDLEARLQIETDDSSWKHEIAGYLEDAAAEAAPAIAVTA